MAGLWDKIKNVFVRKKQAHVSSLKKAFEKIRSENKKRDIRINKIFSRLNSHFLQIQSNTKAIKKLENILQELPGKSALNYANIPSNRLNEPIKRLIATNQAPEQVPHQNRLSPQEKRVLMTLFDNQGTSLSYQDISKLLNKSPNTVKTQINQLKNKTNMLLESTDHEGKKRYGLKENIKMEKFIV